MSVFIVKAEEEQWLQMLYGEAYAEYCPIHFIK